MKLFPLRTNLDPSFPPGIHVRIYTVGTELQSPIARLHGFSASQLFLTVSGEGIFRAIGQEEWNVLTPGTLLYIPAKLPHEYMPLNGAEWHVGYVTFLEKDSLLSSLFGFDGGSPVFLQLQEHARVLKLIEQIWEYSGLDLDVWKSADLFFSLLVEIKKQASAALSEPLPPDNSEVPRVPHRYRQTVVDRATRFLYDHLQRNFTLAELASYVGYSTRQLVRYFQETLGTTPTIYMRNLRLHTAAELLVRHPEMTVRQIAAHVGLEPVYFTRMFRRQYGATPSEYRMENGIPPEDTKKGCKTPHEADFEQ